MKCKRCFSHAINEHMHGRTKGRNVDLCDVCYWRAEYDSVQAEIERLRAHIGNVCSHTDAGCIDCPIYDDCDAPGKEEDAASGGEGEK